MNAGQWKRSPVIRGWAAACQIRTGDGGEKRRNGGVEAFDQLISGPQVSAWVVY
jgi:hypothetical protein